MTIDHLVYSTNNFEKTCAYFENILGVTPMFGGYHQNQGTKNALINLGQKCYFEILAIDETNNNIIPPRWMGIDLIQRPAITRWAIKSDHIEQDAETLKIHNVRMSEIITGERKMENGKLLKWKMTSPLAKPKIEAIPFILDWSDSAHHPTDSLPEQCNLLALKITHPAPESIHSIFQKLAINLDVQKSVETRLSATIESPKGIVEI